MNLTIPTSILEPLQQHVRAWGQKDNEAGGFLLGPHDAPSIDILAFAEGAGVERSRGLFRVSGKALDRLFAWAEDHDRRVWAQVHSHPRGSFLSHTDETYGFRVEGFISAVIPDYATPPLRPETWGWWTFEAGDWRSVAAPARSDLSSRVITFDEEGVR